MQDNWLEFLAGEGARLQGKFVLSFNDALPENEAGLTDWLTALPNHVVVEAVSADAGKQTRHFKDGALSVTDFLQNQFCNDLGSLNEQPSDPQAQLNGYCNPKGRLLALFYLIRYSRAGSEGAEEAAYRMLLPASVADGFVKRLSMFLLGADAKIALQPAWQALVAAGPKAVEPLDTLLDAAGSVADLQPYQAITRDDVQVVRLPAERWLILSETGHAIQHWNILAEALQPVGQHRWTLACIEQGEPSVQVETLEKFIPQMLNLQSIGALSFKKGCFPGQEIVARMQYLGKLKRNMRRISFDSPTLPAVGSAITSGEDADAGTLVSVACSKDGRYEGLAVLKADVDIATLAIDTEPAGQVSAASELSLPYAVELPGCDVKA